NLNCCAFRHQHTTVPFATGLSGLVSGGTYHYRAVASNAAGVVYGNDMSFTNTTVQVQVGPIATTLAPLSVTNTLAALYGSVDPNGKDSIGWFQWGTTTNYGQTTGSTSINGS